jgi:hypothetical protein
MEFASRTRQIRQFQARVGNFDAGVDLIVADAAGYLGVSGSV